MICFPFFNICPRSRVVLAIERQMGWGVCSEVSKSASWTRYHAVARAQAEIFSPRPLLFLAGGGIYETALRLYCCRRPRPPRRAAPPLPPSIHPARRVWLVGSSPLSFLLCTSYPARRRRRPRLFRRRSQSLILASSAASGPHTLLGDRTGAPSNGYDLLEKGRSHY